MRLSYPLAAVPAVAVALSCSPSESAPGPLSEPAPTTIDVSPDAALGDLGQGESGALNRAMAAVDGPTTLRLAPGRYHLVVPSRDDGGGGSPATAGLRVSGDGISILGAHRDSVIIHTGSTTGILFDRCRGCTLRGVTVTGGRSQSGSADPAAAVVVRHSSLTLQRCTVRDNGHDPSPGASGGPAIDGVAGGGGSRLDIRTCRIVGNSGDGIALTGDARATIRGNTIEGRATHRATRPLGTGISMGGRARAQIEENLVRGYDRGISARGDTNAQIRENVIEEIRSWGVGLTSEGGLLAFVERNVVFRTGACGILVDLGGQSAEPGAVSRNVLVETTLDPSFDAGSGPCPQEPLARVRVPDGWSVDQNLFHANRRRGPEGDRELDLEELVEKAMRLYTFEIEPQASTTASAFMEAYQEAFGPPFR